MACKDRNSVLHYLVYAMVVLILVYCSSFGFSFILFFHVYIMCGFFYILQHEVAVDMKQRFIGHCNVGTDIKQASFLGQQGAQNKQVFFFFLLINENLHFKTVELFLELIF